MICACVVTSSAVVASSAISSLGSEARAIAMTTRWRIPPESWCGYSCRRCSGDGRRTSLSSSSARSRAAPRSTRWCARTASATCAPMRIVGFSDRDGSWKTIAMSAPRWRRMTLSESPSSSSPSKRTEPDDVAVGRQQAHHGARADGLPRARLADERQRAPDRQRVAQAVDGADPAVAEIEVHAQVAQLEQRSRRRARCRPRRRRSRSWDAPPLMRRSSARAGRRRGG